MTSLVIIELRRERGATRLGLAVCFHYRTTECALQEGKHIVRDGSACSDHDPDAPAQSFLDLVKDEFIVLVIVDCA